jgi:hypothetical protein
MPYFQQLKLAHEDEDTVNPAGTDFCGFLWLVVKFLG